MKSEEDEEYEFLKVKSPKGKPSKRLDTAIETEKLLKDLSQLFKSSKFGKKKKGKKVHFSACFSNNYNQRCVVKMTYGNSKKAHKNFLRSYMIQENKDEVVEKPTYFDAEYDEVPDTEIERYEAEMTDLYYKFIISPESLNVPLKNLAREFVKNLQLETGFSFSWKGVIHVNTQHRHTHILINGLDRKTRKLIKRIPPRIIRNARLSAEQICTNLVGPVSSKELEIRKKKTITAMRWTNLDDDIISGAIPAKYQSENGTEYYSSITTSDAIIEQRLKSLVDIGLAISFPGNNPPMYYLEKDWAKKLRSIGRYNSFLQARSNLLFTTSGMLEQYTPEAGKICGVVSKVYLMDDESVWTNAIVVENAGESKAWYIPLKNPPSKDLLRQFVTVQCKRNQSGKLCPQIKILGDGSKKSLNKFLGKDYEPSYKSKF